jgi:tRNA(adenine34) deaminase
MAVTLTDSTQDDDDLTWMTQALDQARRGAAAGEVPVGAVVVMQGRLLAAAHNQPITHCDPSAHAEILALRQAAAQLGNYRLTEATLYVTLEPCLMCAGAILQARLQRLVYGASDPKAGAVHSLYACLDDRRLNHRLEVQGGLLADASAQVLRDFFAARRHKPAASGHEALQPLS